MRMVSDVSGVLTFDERIYNWITRQWGKRTLVDAFFVVAARWTPIVMLCVIVIASTVLASTALASQNPGGFVFAPAATSILSAIAVRLVNEPLTRVMKRRRPFEQSLSQPLLHHDEGGSFPSNHAAGAFALAIGFISPSPYFSVLLVLAVLLAVARVYTGLHYVTDVIAGAVNGITVALLVAVLIHHVH